MADTADPDRPDATSGPDEKPYHETEIFLEAMEIEEGLTCADIGVGTPLYTLAVAERIVPGRLYAVDLQGERIDDVKRWAQEQDITNIMPMATGDRGIPVPDGSVDVAWCASSFHEFEAPDTVLRDALRMLKDGGSFFLVDWKAMDSPGGPPLRTRAPLTTLLKALREGGFDKLKNHDIFEYHHCVQATK